MNRLKSNQSLLTFFLLLAVLTVLMHLVGSKFLQGNLHSFLLMWIPGIAALSASLIAQGSLRGFGWGFSGKWLITGWLFPVLYGLVTYGIIWASGLGDLPSETFIERAKFTLGMESDSHLLIIFSAFFYITVLNLIPNMIITLGEEIGWRGYLVPRLMSHFSFGKTAILSGIIWGGWHLPAIMNGNYGPETIPLWFKLICFGIMVVTTATILSWIRLKSDSLWPAVVFHAVHNGSIQMFFDRITIDTGSTQYFTGEFGIGLALTTGVIAWIIYLKSKQMNEFTLNTNIAGTALKRSFQ